VSGKGLREKFVTFSAVKDGGEYILGDIVLK
jgi:hypothetical protein